AKVKHTAQATRVTERKIRLAQVREQLEATRLGLVRVSGEQTAALRRQSELESEEQELATQRGATAALLLTARSEANDTAAERDEARVQLDEVRRLLDEVRTGLGGREAELRELRNALGELEER